MKKLTKTEINFIKETGWTPAVEQCDEWERTIFVNLFNKATFKKKHLDEDYNEDDPIKIDNSDSKFLFDNEDAIVVDLKKGNSN